MDGGMDGWREGNRDGRMDIWMDEMVEVYAPFDEWTQYSRLAVAF